MIVPGTWSIAVNASGHVAGVVVPQDAEGNTLYDQQYIYTWDPDMPEDPIILGSPTSTDPFFYYTSPMVLALSDAGDILLTGSMCFDTNDDGQCDYSTYHTWVFSNGVYTTVNNDATGSINGAVMSPAGYVAGWFRNYLTWDSFYWDRNVSTMLLPGLGGNETYAVALNDRKQVAGSSMTGDGKSRAVIWTMALVSFALNGVPESATIDEMAPYVLMMERIAAEAERFDVIHFHIDYLHFPLMRRLGLRHLTTLHGRQDVPDLQPLYGEFNEMPIVSISEAQRAPLPHAAANR
jgi:hypothetical protein